MRELLKTDKLEHIATVETRIPCVLTWTCEPLYHLGNDAHCLAKDTKEQKRAWSVFGWRLKLGAKYQSNYIRRLEANVDKMARPTATLQDVRDAIQSSLATADKTQLNEENQRLTCEILRMSAAHDLEVGQLRAENQYLRYKIKNNEELSDGEEEAPVEGETKGSGPPRRTTGNKGMKRLPSPDKGSIPPSSDEDLRLFPPDEGFKGLTSQADDGEASKASDEEKAQEDEGTKDEPPRRSTRHKGTKCPVTETN